MSSLLICNMAVENAAVCESESAYDFVHVHMHMHKI